MSRSLGILVKLMHESTGHMVTVELKSGELYRGSTFKTLKRKLGSVQEWEDFKLPTGNFVDHGLSWLMNFPAKNLSCVSDVYYLLVIRKGCIQVIQSGSILVVQFPSLVLGVVGRAGGIALSGVRDGKISQLEHVFIRGRRVRFMITPDMLKNAPMFKRLDARIKCKRTSLGVGCGRAVAMRAKAQATGRGTAGRGVVPPVRR
uniref:Uncharacterized protein n=1 Tax=Chenopodium quinoa TaxID=63459 RepID=A0A803M585_CHEQI